MKSKASYFSISVPLIKENFRRFWAIPAISFLAYFLSSTFPILMGYSHINDMYDYIQMCLSNVQPIFMLTHLCLPIITAVITFRFIQNSSAVTTMHSLPFSRNQLFNTSIVSGLILIILPLLANEILLQVIAKPTYDFYMYVNEGNTSILSDTAINVFTRTNVLQWFWQSLIIVLFIYAIAVFAGMVTGNVVMHLSLALGFNFLAPSLYLAFIAYCSSYLFGYTSTGASEEILLGLSPFTKILANNGYLSIKLEICYILVAIIILLISHRLYTKRQMEKTGDSLVFKFMIPTICFLISYFGMTLMGYYFKSLNYNEQNSDMYFYGGLAAGAIITFIIGRMVVLKTPRIFNKESLKSFGIFSLLAIIFITSITLDLTGFENRVPYINKVKGISSTSFKFVNGEDRYSSHLFKHENPELEYDNFYYTTPENIESFINLHKYIVDNKNEFGKDLDNDKKYYTFNLSYDLPNPFGLSRTYRLTHDKVKENKDIKKIYESKEFKDYFSLYNLDCEKMASISLSNIYFYDEIFSSNLLISDKNKVTQLLDAIEKDFQNRTFEESMSRKHPYCNLSLSYKVLDKEQKLVDSYLTLRVLLSDTNTIKWLKSNNYSQYLECTPDMVKKIVFIKHGEEKGITTQNQNSSYVDEDENQLIITDKNQIQEVLNTYGQNETNYSQYYKGYIVYNAEHDYISDYKNEQTDIYYDYDNVPSFISDYFN